MKKIKDEGKGVSIPDELKPNEVEVDRMEDMIKSMKAEIDLAISQREEFITKQNKWYRKRYGIRPKATFPWFNASNLHIPVQDKMIRKLKPEYVGVAYNTTPICELSTENPQNMEVAEQASWQFDYLLRTRMDIFADVNLMTDKMLSKGFCIVKVIYDRQTESRPVKITKEEAQKELLKSLANKDDADILTNPAKMELLIQILCATYGFDREDESDYGKMVSICQALYNPDNEAVEFTIDEVKYDAPKWIVLDPEDIIVPSDCESVFDLEKCRWICHRYQISPEDLLAGGLSGKWDRDWVDDILAKRGIYDEDLRKSKTDGLVSTVPTAKISQGIWQKNAREGLTQVDYKSRNITINEICMWYDYDGDGKEERHILDFCEESPHKAGRFIRYPYRMLQWPYVKVVFELADNRHYSPRGVVETLDPLASALNVQHNMKINRQTIASTPSLMYAPGKINPDNMRFIPGKAVPVVPPVNQNAMWMTAPNTDMTFVQEEAALKGYCEEYMAANDYGVQRQSGGKATATEINYNASSRVGIRQLDIQIFQASLKEIFKRTWSLEMQFATDEEFTYLTSDGQPARISKSKLGSDNYHFQPMGRFGSSDPTLKAQIAQRNLEEFKGDPFIDQYELYREHFSNQDPRSVKRLLKSKEQIAQDQQQAQQQQAQQMEDMARLGMLNQQAKQGDRRGMTQITGGRRNQPGGHIQ